MPVNVSTTFLGKLVAAVRRDPQKAGILTVLVAILVVLQVRLQMGRGGDGASRATAAINRGVNGRGFAGAGGSSAGPRDSAAALRTWLEAPPEPLSRNLFAVDLERFPNDTNRPLAASAAGSGFWDELAKSMTFRTDVRKERQILLENLQQQASQLRLQSTMMGASPKAVVDGEMVGEGDVVASGSGETRTVFRVLKIEPRRIIVEREGIKLEIPMK